MRNKSLSPAVVITGFVVGLVGLLNVVLGIRAVISGAFPSSEGNILAPTISIGAIIFGLIMLAGGALWLVSGIGHFTRKEWSHPLALYTAPFVVAINIVGVLDLWGFSVGIGWASLSTVAGVGSIWYLSKKELASFFLISVAEHVFIIAIFAALIYGEPASIAEETPDDELIVSVETIEQKDPILAEIIPRERMEVKKPPALPKMEIETVTPSDRGPEVEGSVPQLPRTVADVEDTGDDMVLRSPIAKQTEQNRQDDRLPALDVETTLDNSQKPSLEIGPSDRAKSETSRTVGIESKDGRDDISFHDERVGPSDEVAKPSFAGEITGDIEGRRVVSWPKPPEGYAGTKGGSVVVKFWVDPAGNVTKVELSKKSGSPKLDRMATEYVKQIRFEELPKNFKRIAQWGEIPISFELTRGAG